MTSTQIITKIWNFCHILRDAGVSYGDYLEQLTYLIFLKMAYEYANPPYNHDLGIPAKYNWQSLKTKRGAVLESHYIELLRELGKKKGILGQIFTQSHNKIQDSAMLSRVVEMIDNEAWVTMGADIKGDIYEGLLEKNAEDTKSGAGQYFTPRALIKVMVKCVRPEPFKTLADPACGTGGFFLETHNFIRENYNLDEKQTKFLKHETFYGHEIVPNTRRLCLMNMLLHNIGDINSEPTISPNDALAVDSKQRFDYVLANPPFGKKSSITATNGEGEQEKKDFTYNRQDFWATTSNKQLNFIQHIFTMLKNTGKASVIVPDNVLFEGGAGEIVRQNLLQKTDLHTILRLPTGIFYAHGVKANVLFFDNKPAREEPWTKEVWYYDYRTNIHNTLKKKSLQFEDLENFIQCYSPEDRSKRRENWYSETDTQARWRKFSYEEIMIRDKTSLDIFWLKDKSLSNLDNLPEPDEIAEEIVENLAAALNSFKVILNVLENDTVT